MSKEKQDALKGRKVFVYLRVSTEEQTGTLETQEQSVLEGLTNLGFTGKPEIYQEQASGTKIDRPQLQAMLAAAKDSKRPAIIVVRESKDLQETRMTWANCTTLSRRLTFLSCQSTNPSSQGHARSRLLLLTCLLLS